jgi:hypothetical protein
MTSNVQYADGGDTAKIVNDGAVLYIDTLYDNEVLITVQANDGRYSPGIAIGLNDLMGAAMHFAIRGSEHDG